MRKDVRVWFTKTATAQYISHLDLTRCMSRAFRKAKLPIWYTEGFNPRVYMTFAAPLSLGFEGLQESMDIRLIEDMPFDAVMEQLNAGLPHDIRVYNITEPVMKGNDVAYAEYVIHAPSQNPQELMQRLQSLLQQPELLVQKHSKKGDKTVDIRPHFAQMQFAAEETGVCMTVRLPAGNQGGINPSLFFDAAEKYLSEKIFIHVTRTGLFDEKFAVFQ